MRLLMKWLRPDTVPSPRRKNIPTGVRLQLSLYRSCLRKLQHWYSKYAFSDTISIGRNPQMKIVHEFRDVSFEMELKRLRVAIPENIKDRSATASFLPEKLKKKPYFNLFNFKDTFVLEVNGRKISIDHGMGRSFVSTIRGKLKESAAEDLVARYGFWGSLREERPAAEPAREKPRTATPPRRSTGPLFADDPLLRQFREKPQTPPDPPAPPKVKSVAGLEIDESF